MTDSADRRPAGVLEIDSDGTILYADGEARRLLGEDLLGLSVDALAPPGHAELRKAYMLAPSVRTMVGRLVEARRTDGARVLIHVGLLPLSGGRVAVAVSHGDSAIAEGSFADVLDETATRMERLASVLQ